MLMKEVCLRDHRDVQRSKVKMQAEYHYQLWSEGGILNILREIEQHIGGTKWRQTENSIHDHGCHGLSSMLVGNRQRTTRSVESGTLPRHTASPGSMTNRLLREFAPNK